MPKERLLGAVWSVEWNHAYREPPEGKPRVLIEVFKPEGHPEVRGIHPPAEVRAVLDGVGLGSGYGLNWRPISKPIRPLDQAVLARVRRMRLERRMRQKYPLLAEEMIREELERKPAYYNGITDPGLQANRDEVLTKEAERVTQWLEEWQEWMKS